MDKKYTKSRSMRIYLTADFETFTPDSEYFLRHIQYNKDGTINYSHCKSNIYAYSLSRIPVTYNKKTKAWELLNAKKGRSLLNCKFGYTLNEFMDAIQVKDNRNGTYYKEVVIWFHNGQKFDFHFIHAWIQEQDNWYFYVNDDLHKEGSTVDKCLQEYKGKNLYHFEKLGNYLALDVYIWNEKAGYHIHIDFWDSLLLIKESVEDIAKNYINTDNDVAHWIKEHFPNENLHKEKDIDFTDYQDIKGNELILKGGVKWDINGTPSKGHNKIRVLYSRVVNDSLIVAAYFSYLIVNNVISVPNNPRLFRTAGSLAIAYFSTEYLHSHPNIPMDDYNPNIWWDKYIWEVDKDKKENICKIFQPYLTGGFCSFNELYLEKVIENKTIFSYDVNSLYPYVVSTFELPYGEYIESDTPIKGMYCFVWFECDEIEQLNKRVCNMIPKKWVAHNITAILNHKEVKVLNSSLNTTPQFGSMYGYVTHMKGDIKGFLSEKLFNDCYMDKDHFRIEGLRNVKWLCFKTKFFMKDFMDKHFKNKVIASGYEYKDGEYIKCDKNASKGRKELAKLLLNSPTGKLGEKIFKSFSLCFGDIYDDDMDLDNIYNMIDGEVKTSKEYLIKYLNNPKENKDMSIIYNDVKMVNHAFYPAYQAITFEARYKTIKTQLDMTKKYKDMVICYSDTDSIKGFSDGSLFSDDITDNIKLGYWKQEFIKKDNKVVKFIVYRAKTWIAQWQYPKKDLLEKGLSPKDAVIDLATGGVNPKDVRVAMNGDIENILRIKEYPTLLSYKTAFGVVLVNGFKALKNNP